MRFINLENPVNRSAGLNRGLAAWWKVLPGRMGGTRLMDLCGRAHGTLTSGPTWRGSGGRQGGYGAIEFDGTNDYVLTTATNIGSTNRCTIALWMKLDSKGAFDGIIMNSARTGALIINNAFGNQLAYMWEGTVDEYGATTSLTPVVGQWHFAALVITPSQATIYLDRSSFPSVKTLNAKNLSTTWDIGRDSFDYPNRMIDGLLDDIKIYDRSLSSHEIAQLRMESSFGCPQTLNWVRRRDLVAAQAAAGNRRRRVLMTRGL